MSEFEGQKFAKTACFEGIYLQSSLSHLKDIFKAALRVVVVSENVSLRSTREGAKSASHDAPKRQASEYFLWNEAGAPPWVSYGIHHATYIHKISKIIWDVILAKCAALFRRTLISIFVFFSLFPSNW